MKKLTANEIRNILIEKMEINEFAYGEYPSGFRTRSGTGTDILDEIGECIEVDSHGGEGQGEDWHSVKFFPDHNVYLKVEGFYQSYNGTEFYNGWGDCFEVTPKEKVIIVYEKV